MAAPKQNICLNYRAKMFLISALFVVSICSFTNGFMDMDELKSVYYGLDILSEPVVLNEETLSGAVHVTSKYGQHYQCTFPDHSLEEKKKEEEEKLAIETGIVDMLKPMGEKDCLFKTKDWWSYEFCYGKYVRQFHLHEGEVKGDVIYLGNYHSDFDWDNVTAKDERLRSKTTISRYHSQTYTEGTKCDLTGQPRRAEVRFLCEENSEDYLERVDESETCVYTVTVKTSKICRHPFLKAPARRKPVAITCNPLLTQDQWNDWMEEKEAQKQKEEILKKASKLKFGGGTKVHMTSNDLDKSLADAMSSIAKDLLSKPVDEIIPKQEKTQRKVMTREEFEAIYGDEEDLYDLYLRFVELNKKRQDEVQRRLAEAKEKKQEVSKDDLLPLLSEAEEKSKTEKDISSPDEENAQEDDDDDDILAEFDDEINMIKARFQSSKDRVSAIQKKMAVEKQWESELENVIKEAESQLGVKVDRTLISGLSNTLDKLVNKLHDTQAQLSSMDSELEKLDKADLKEKDDEDDEDNDEEDEDLGKMESEEGITTDTPVVETAQPNADGENIIDERIGTPTSGGLFGTGGPTGPEGDDILGGEEEMFGNGAAEGGVDNGGAGGGEGLEADGEITITADVVGISDADGDDDEEKGDLGLPKNVQKLLEESVQKEVERHRNSANKPLRFDADNSFHKDKQVHVIQEEDENGKTNKFIFVVGFDMFNDETSETAKQNELEENYSFQYKERKQKKIGPDS